MNKHICIREAFDWINIGDKKDELTQNEYDELMKYLKNNININEKFIQIGYKKIKFVNYVGILNIGNVTVEILPKFNLSDDRSYDKKVLLQMLSKCLDLDLNLDKTISSKTQSYSLLELIAARYIDCLLREINKGVHFEYKNQNENLNVMKGKLIFSKHVKHNYCNKVKVFCDYSEYSADNLLNQVLKIACIKILNKIYDFEINSKIKKILFSLGDVTTISINKEVIERIKLNRQNKRFFECLELAKFILLNISNESSVGNKNGFTMLFEMNTLYEQYIGKLIKSIWSGEEKSVALKDRSRYLLIDTETKKKKFNLEPDIVLKENNSHKLIIDTKWKAVEYDGKVSCRVEDAYQMYAYVTTYKEVNRVILLYPCLIKENEYPNWELASDKNKFIEIKTVRLDEYNNTIEDLKSIIS